MSWLIQFLDHTSWPEIFPRTGLVGPYRLTMVPLSENHLVVLAGIMFLRYARSFGFFRLLQVNLISPIGFCSQVRPPYAHLHMLAGPYMGDSRQQLDYALSARQQQNNYAFSIAAKIMQDSKLAPKEIKKHFTSFRPSDVWSRWYYGALHWMVDDRHHNQAELNTRWTNVFGRALSATVLTDGANFL